MGSAQGVGDCVVGAMQKYLAQVLVRHLATMFRMYNDYGSIARDRVERNVNSVNFPEFHEEAQNADKEVSEEGIKQSLFEIAEYEIECLGLAKGETEEICAEKGE